MHLSLGKSSPLLVSRRKICLSLIYLFILFLFFFHLISAAILDGIEAQMTGAEEQLLPHYVWHYRPMKDTTCPQIPTAVVVSTKSDGRYRLLFRINHFPIKLMKDATTRYL